MLPFVMKTRVKRDDLVGHETLAQTASLTQGWHIGQLGIRCMALVCAREHICQII